jgi:hypothetical protein
MKNILVFCMAILVLSTCAAQNLDTLKRATLDGNMTVETTLNAFAGPNGDVSWYNPSEHPGNANFKLLGAKVSNPSGSADFVLIIDTTSMTATMKTVTFNGKTIHYDQFGLPDDMDAFQEVLEWAVMGSVGSKDNIKRAIFREVSLEEHFKPFVEHGCLVSYEYDFSFSEHLTDSISTNIQVESRYGSVLYFFSVDFFNMKAFLNMIMLNRGFIWFDSFGLPTDVISFTEYKDWLYDSLKE